MRTNIHKWGVIAQINQLIGLTMIENKGFPVYPLDRISSFQNKVRMNNNSIVRKVHSAKMFFVKKTNYRQVKLS
jgi:hypothetical protein